MMRMMMVMMVMMMIFRRQLDNKDPEIPSKDIRFHPRQG